MKFSKFTPEMVSELLVHLADHERFSSLKPLHLAKGDIQNMLHEIADQIKEVTQNGPVVNRSQIKKEDFTSQTSRVISHLSPLEEDILLKSFKISDE